MVNQFKFNRLLKSNHHIQIIFWYLKPSFDQGHQKLENMANFIVFIIEPKNKFRIDFEPKYQVNIGHQIIFFKKKLFSKISAVSKIDNNKI